MGSARRVKEPRWLDEQEQQAWRGFLRGSLELRSRLNRHLLDDSGLSLTDYEILANLSETPGGRLRAFELCQLMQWEKSRLSHQLRRMERRGLVAREECTTDARGAWFVLTKAGRKAVESAAPAHVEHVRRLFVDALGPRKLDGLRETCESILARLEDDGDL